jgi:hypothetical protein
MPNQNVLTLLKKDHAKVKDLLGQLSETTERGLRTRGELLAEIEMELEVHAQVEEELFYPAYKEAVERKEDRKHFFEATEEHALVRQVLAELKETAPDSETFGARAKILKDLVEHHAKEEETQMFKIAREVMDAEQLRDLGERVEERKQGLQQEMRAVHRQA